MLLALRQQPCAQQDWLAEGCLVAAALQHAAVAGMLRPQANRHPQ
jgi:hypothetical protein